MERGYWEFMGSGDAQGLGFSPIPSHSPGTKTLVGVGSYHAYDYGDGNDTNAINCCYSSLLSLKTHPGQRSERGTRRAACP